MTATPAYLQSSKITKQKYCFKNCIKENLLGLDGISKRNQVLDFYK